MLYHETGIQIIQKNRRMALPTNRQFTDGRKLALAVHPV